MLRALASALEDIFGAGGGEEEGSALSDPMIRRVLVRRLLASAHLRPSRCPALTQLVVDLLARPLLQFVGLGNPGAMSLRGGVLDSCQRHNVGAAAVEVLARSLAALHAASLPAMPSDASVEPAAEVKLESGAAGFSAPPVVWKRTHRSLVTELPLPVRKARPQVDYAHTGARAESGAGSAGAGDGAAKEPDAEEGAKQTSTDAEVGSDEAVLAVLAQPSSFMNASGGPTKRCMTAYAVEAPLVCVLHDDLELPFGKIKVKTGGSHKGHNGLKSIISSIGTRDFYRLRIGIGRPESREPGVVADYVLGSFAKDEIEELNEKVFDAVSSHALHWAAHAHEEDSHRE